MDYQFLIHTAEAQCQDCYKCVRECPVKAIRIEKHHASVLPELCTSCGRCVDVCPAQAKIIRDDIGRVNRLLSDTQPVIVSIAPSWICEFPEVSQDAMISALKQLGFAGVSETALGAQAVSHDVSRYLCSIDHGLVISSACPVVVEWIKRYQPHLTDQITQVVSPLLAHCRMLREHYTQEIKIVFFGPCIAKKLESDNDSYNLNVALTFKDLRQMLAQAKIDLDDITPETQQWALESGQAGRLYPAEGGMIKTLTPVNAELICISGLTEIQADIDGIHTVAQNRPVFLEALACSGGCINGPAMTCAKNAGLARKLRIFNQHQNGVVEDTENTYPDLFKEYKRVYIPQQQFSDMDIANALKLVDKTSSSDELNCGGCGYETCREFARAMVQKKAEPEMCVSYMRKKAQKKANALLRSIPSGVVIVGKDLNIIECNKAFAEMFDEDTRNTFETLGSLENAQLNEIVPFSDLFTLALQTGKDICRENYVANERVLNLTIFSIQPDEIAGAVIQDVTEVQWRRQQVARNARKVLRSNLAIVQDIAHKLGEHMADNEILLSNIANSYSDDLMGEDYDD